MTRNKPIPFEISTHLQNATAEMSPHIPASWFHPIGIRKVLKRLEPRLPETKNSLFLTFTLDPKRFEDEQEGFEKSRDKLRRIFFQLRKGVSFDGEQI